MELGENAPASGGVALNDSNPEMNRLPENNGDKTITFDKKSEIATDAYQHRIRHIFGSLGGADEHIDASVVEASFQEIPGCSARIRHLKWTLARNLLRVERDCQSQSATVDFNSVPNLTPPDAEQLSEAASVFRQEAEKLDIESKEALTEYHLEIGKGNPDAFTRWRSAEKYMNALKRQQKNFHDHQHLMDASRDAALSNWSMQQMWNITEAFEEMRSQKKRLRAFIREHWDLLKDLVRAAEDGRIPDDQLPTVLTRSEALDKGGQGILERTPYGVVKYLINTSGSPEVREAADIRFKREIHGLEHLGEKTTATPRLLIDGERSASRKFFSMEEIKGENFRAVYERVTTGNLDMQEERKYGMLKNAVGSFRQVHAAGVVHRDVKPANLILQEGDAANVKVIDFGMQRLRHDRGAAVPDRPSCEETLTLAGQADFGTPEYTAPAQARGGPPDPRNDLYSLGLIIYEFLTKQRVREHFKGADSLLQRLKLKERVAADKYEDELPLLYDDLRDEKGNIIRERLLPEEQYAIEILLRREKVSVEGKDALDEWQEADEMSNQAHEYLKKLQKGNGGWWMARAWRLVREKLERIKEIATKPVAIAIEAAAGLTLATGIGINLANKEDPKPVAPHPLPVNVKKPGEIIVKAAEGPHPIYTTLTENIFEDGTIEPVLLHSADMGGKALKYSRACHFFQDGKCIGSTGLVDAREFFGVTDKSFGYFPVQYYTNENESVFHLDGVVFMRRADGTHAYLTIKKLSASFRSLTLSMYADQDEKTPLRRFFASFPDSKVECKEFDVSLMKGIGMDKKTAADLFASSLKLRSKPYSKPPEKKGATEQKTSLLPFDSLRHQFSDRMKAVSADRRHISAVQARQYSERMDGA